jgi:hypothetical protein
MPERAMKLSTVILPGFLALSSFSYAQDNARLAATPFFATRLLIGMTDTQVLNLPSWGRPARIIRSKAGHVWREQWIYRDRGTSDERTFLYFENARLVDQEDAPPSPSIQARAAAE